MAVKKGDNAPAFSLFDTERKERSLSEFIGKKTILAFYPGAFTGVCTKEMCAFRDSMANFNEMNAQMVGISVDSPFANKAFADQNKLAFPLLSDHSRKVSETYAGLYKDFAGVTGYTAAKRSVFVLDVTGTVVYVWVTEKPGDEPPYDEVEKAVSAAK